MATTTGSTDGPGGPPATAKATPPRLLVDALERATALDVPAEKIAKAVRDALSPGKVKNALSGTWFGHAVHPPLTDVVIGAFTSASLLDLLGDRSWTAQERLIGVGIAAAVPTALTGASDWADAEPADDGVRRVGLVHANLNTTALAVYAASLAARRRGAYGRGAALALAGMAILTVSSYLGGHMSFTRGVGANQTAFDPGPREWTYAADSAELAVGEPKAAVAGDAPVLLVRHEHGVHAIHDRCSHRGCALSDGDIDGHVVTCACHGSRYDLEDGTVMRGPATAGQPLFDAREADGRVEVRLARRN
ncbi:MAG: Rieske 2Fe-2S domain-containing protein [Thermoleophilaceae bacterium]